MRNNTVHIRKNTVQIRNGAPAYEFFTRRIHALDHSIGQWEYWLKARKYDLSREDSDRNRRRVAEAEKTLNELYNNRLRALANRGSN